MLSLIFVKVLGFDCEWANYIAGASRPVSLIQLATLSGLCVLVRVHLLSHVPDSLRNLLADRRFVFRQTAVNEWLNLLKA